MWNNMCICFRTDIKNIEFNKNHQTLNDRCRGGALRASVKKDIYINYIYLISHGFTDFSLYKEK